MREMRTYEKVVSVEVELYKIRNASTQLLRKHLRMQFVFNIIILKVGKL